MSDQDLAEAMQLILSMSQNDFGSILAAFRSPAPRVSPRAIEGFVQQWNSPPARQQRLLWQDPIFIQPGKPGFEYLEMVYSDPSTGLRFQKGIPYRHELRIDEKWLEEAEAIFKAAEKLQIPDGSAKDAKLEGVMKNFVARQAIKTAMFNGVWQGAAMTSVLDVNLLLNGEFKQYLIRIGVSGLFGGTVGGLSSWINHPFFGNGMVLGVLVGSAFGTVSLASTGDWVRFGKSFGISITGAAAAYGGGALGAAIGSVGGPIGTAIGTLAGSMLAGYFGRQVAGEIPGLSGMTEYEVKTMYEGIKQQLALTGLEPDPSLSPLEVVTALQAKGCNGKGGVPFQVQPSGAIAADITGLRGTLQSMQSSSPEGFDELLSLLRAAASKE